MGATGVCLTDVHLIEGAIAPRYLAGDAVTLSHEVAGTIDALGPGVTGWFLLHPAPGLIERHARHGAAHAVLLDRDLPDCSSQRGRDLGVVVVALAG